MSLEFNKLHDQLMRMGAMIEKLDFDLTDRLRVAIERFEAASDVEAIQERIDLVRQSDISGYRGAAPLGADYAQPINLIYPPPPMPEYATIIAADGSQIYANEQSPVHYYLINVGMYIYHHGIDHLPEPITMPTLAFHKDHVHDHTKRVVSNRTVDARRTVAEMQALAEKAWEMKDRVPSSIIALYDNHLLFWVNSDVTGSEQVTKDYHAALVQLHDVHANGTPTILAGYVDNPHRSRVVLRLLFLMSLQDEREVKMREKELAYGGDLEGLRDRHLFNAVLRPGERSAVMVQNSPKNLAYKQRGVSYEIAFFYIKVGDHYRSNIARVDVPMWVARDERALNDLHAVLLAQCQMQGRNPYPYALTRADELAYVSAKDKNKLEEVINLELRRNGVNPFLYNAKTRGKELARSDRRPYELRTDL
ncbi:MAG: DNA double-strand break repair nuclease NurA [Anaerolineae bacterium]